MPQKKNTIADFWAKVDKDAPNGCWQWMKPSNQGYADFRFNHHRILVHRFAYELLIGEIPKGFELDHLCRNILCVNPDHLEAVTHRDNIRRGNLHNIGSYQRQKTHCPHGHPYNNQNTYRRADGYRRCRICRLLSDRKQRQKRDIHAKC